MPPNNVNGKAVIFPVREIERRSFHDQVHGLSQELEKERERNKALVARIAIMEANAARLGFDPEEMYKPILKPVRTTHGLVRGGRVSIIVTDPQSILPSIRPRAKLANAMGIGIVLIFWGVVGLIGATIGSAILPRIASYFTQGAVQRSRRLIWAIRLFPFACLVWAGGVFISMPW